MVTMEDLEGQRGWWWHPLPHAVLKLTSHTGARLRAQLRRRPRRVQVSAEFPAIHCSTQLLRGDRRGLNEKTNGRVEEATAHKRVRYRQLCCRGRSARAAGTRTHPADATRWFETPPRKDASPPRQKSSSAVTGAQKSASSPSCRARSGGGWGSVTRRLQACRCGPSPHAAGRRLPPALRVPLVAGLAVVRSHWIKACRASHERVCRRASCTVNSLELY